MDLAVVDPLPMYRRGVVAVLSAAGHRVATPEDPLGWAHREPSGLVILTLAAEPDWGMLRRLRDQALRHSVIAVLADGSAASGARAVRSGARSVLPRDVDADSLRRTVEATIDGQAVLPAPVAAVLARGMPAAPESDTPVAPEHVRWLGHLARGMTVAQLARQAGYSERAMFRLLKGLYRQLGARNRIEAIMRAQRQGWLHLGGDATD
jgi:DNA-binding NarL/FixJ family response regulator